MENTDSQDPDLINVMAKSSKSVLSYIILDKLSLLLRLPRNNLNLVVATTVFFIIIQFLSWLFDRLMAIPVSWSELWILAVPALGAGMFLWLITILEKKMFDANFSFIHDLAVEKSGKDALKKWFQTKFLVLPQLFLSIVVGLLGVVSSIYLLRYRPDISSTPGVYIGIFALFFGLGNGTYFALQLPTIIMVASKHRLNLYPFEPVKSLVVQKAREIISILTLGTGIAATVIMILIFIINPFNNDLTQNVATIWLIFVWLVTFYTFFFSHHFLRVGIQNEKQKQIAGIDFLIIEYKQKMRHITKQEWDQLQALMVLRELVYRSANSPIHWSSIINLIFSLLMPTLSFFIGVLDLLPIMLPLFQ